MFNVFVYGTLKHGHSNSVVMENSQAEFLGEDETEPKFTMYSNGAFPAVIEKGETPIKGEVYRVKDMSRLDSLEGYPDFYNRKLIDTKYGPAWIYMMPEIHSSYWKEVPSGVW